MPTNYDTIIGLEIHVQLKTKSKLFCSCDNAGETQPPNTTICEVCTAQPGTLPVPNQQAIDWAARAALALNCAVAPVSKFDRKHYFYPDLPKGYQISQYDQPIGRDGYLDIELDGQAKRIRVERVHLEEDSAKLLHEPGSADTLIDFNRSGTPLIEIVTRPDITTPEEARAFLKELKLIIVTLGVSDAEMEKGHLRVDANISLRPEGEATLQPKTEIKNLNSFRSVERALEYERERQLQLWEAGLPPKTLSTRGWEERKSETVEQRTKEESADYRYFPEPDIPPLQFSPEYLQKIVAETPELPASRKARFASEYGFTPDDARNLVSNPDLADYGEKVLSELRAWLLAEHVKDRGVTWNTHKEEFAKLAANWLLNRFLKLLDDAGQTVRETSVTAENFAEFLKLIWEGSVQGAPAQSVLETMVREGGDPSNIIEEKQLGRMEDEATLHAVIDEVLKAHPDEVAAYKAGKIALVKFFMGQIMKRTNGRADAEVANRLLLHKLR